MKLGILGGSFNPVHNGHLYIAQKAIEELNLDRVVFVPAYQSPFKKNASGMTDNADKRILMLAAAVSGDPRFAVDDCEIKRRGVSYTVDTLEDIIMRYTPAGKPYLIIGDDLAADFPKWKDSGRILELAEIVIGRRGQGVGSREVFTYPHILLDNEVIDISSSKIRKMIKEGKEYTTLVPSFFSSFAAPPHFFVNKIEDIARETLTIHRFLHSRNTALLAYDMCSRFGLDPMDGYLAGIAHDLAKQYNPKEMLKLAKKDGGTISPLEKERPNLLHGRAAAVLLREQFSIHNKDILEAVAVHTSGTADMGQLAKVIYIADKMEVSRAIAPDSRKMCYEAELDVILYEVLKKTVMKLKEKELDLSDDTLKLITKMNKSFSKKEENIEIA